MAPAASPLVPWGQLLSGALGHHGREAHPGVSRGQPPAGSCLGKVTTRRAGAGEAGVLGEGSRWELSIRASPWLQARRSVIITPACELSVFRYPDGGASKNVPSVCWGRKVKMSQAARPAPPGQHRRSNKGGKTRAGPAESREMGNMGRAFGSGTKSPGGPPPLRRAASGLLWAGPRASAPPARRQLLGQRAPSGAVPVAPPVRARARPRSARLAVPRRAGQQPSSPSVAPTCPRAACPLGVAGAAPWVSTAHPGSDVAGRDFARLAQGCPPSVQTAPCRQLPSGGAENQNLRVPDTERALRAPV
ncbi:caskin-2-like [Bubalus bubalis]|uniref:caskin-2-like n=1 Tax=Bubalus bubalis TaxID=89462 RepID=UPI001E1B79B0|nr:caskin-2-like [Bubalus bubalis]